jgi:toxin ParE1/3/4
VKLTYSPEAVQDLIRAREFIAQNNPSAANRIASELARRIEHLCSFPEIGVAVEQPSAKTTATIRDFSFGDYIVRCVSYEETVIILRIWHHYENRK